MLTKLIDRQMSNVNFFNRIHDDNKLLDSQGLAFSQSYLTDFIYCPLTKIYRKLHDTARAGQKGLFERGRLQ
jgi:hypothetical protein